MDGLSKTDEVLALLNRRERGEAPRPVSPASHDDGLGFTDFLPSPAAAVLHKLQRVSAQPRTEQPVSLGLNRTPSDALKVVLGEQRPPQARQLRCALTHAGDSQAMHVTARVLCHRDRHIALTSCISHTLPRCMHMHAMNASQHFSISSGSPCNEQDARRRSTASFRKKLFGHEQPEGYEDNIITQDLSVNNVRVHPLSAFKRYWDLAIVIMVAYTVVVLPVRCALSWDYYHALDAGHNIFHQLAVRLSLLALFMLFCIIAIT